MARFFLFFFFLIHTIFAKSTVLINENFKKQNISSYISYYSDQSSLWRLNEIHKLKDSFTRNNKEFIDIGFTNSTIWLNFKVKNESQSVRRLYVVIPSATLDYAELYSRMDYSRKIISQIAGDNVPISKWSNPNFSKPSFLIELSPNTKKNFYILIKTESLVRFPIFIYDIDSQEKSEQFSTVIHWIFFTIVVLFLIYNTFLFFHYKKIIYLYYILFIVFFYLNAFLVFGTGYRILWPNQPDLHNRTQVLFLSLSLASALMLVQDFVNRKNPLANSFNSIFASFGIGFICLSILCIMGIRISFRIYIFNSLYLSCLSFSIYMLYATWKKNNSKDTLYLLLAMTSLGFLGALNSLLNLGILGFSEFSTYSGFFFSPIVLVLISYSFFINALDNKATIELHPENENNKEFNPVKSYSKKRKEKIKLSKEQEEKLKEKIHFLLEQQKIYKQNFLNLESFAKYLSIDPDVLEAFFERVYNYEFNEYLNRLRIEKAKYLLEISNAKVNALSSEVGFSDNKSFLEIFKKLTGQSPVEYRKKIGRENKREK